MNIRQKENIGVHEVLKKARTASRTNRSIDSFSKISSIKTEPELHKKR